MNNLNSQLIVRQPQPDSWTFQVYWSSLSLYQGPGNGFVCNHFAGLFGLFFFPLSCLTLANNLQQKDLSLLFSEHGAVAQQQFQCPGQHMQPVLGLRWHWVVSEWPSRVWPWRETPSLSAGGILAAALQPQQGCKAFAVLSPAASQAAVSSMAQLLTRRHCQTPISDCHQLMAAGKTPMVLCAPGAVLGD